MNGLRSETERAGATPHEEEKARSDHGNGSASGSPGTTLFYPLLSPYLCQPLDRSYRDFLEEHIVRLEAERRRIEGELALLYGERERIAARG